MADTSIATLKGWRTLKEQIALRREIYAYHDSLARGLPARGARFDFDSSDTGTTPLIRSPRIAVAIRGDSDVVARYEAACRAAGVVERAPEWLPRLFAVADAAFIEDGPSGARAQTITRGLFAICVDMGDFCAYGQD